VLQHCTHPLSDPVCTCDGGSPLPFCVFVGIPPPELVTPAKQQPAKKRDPAALRRSIKAKRANQARLDRRRPSPTPLCAPSLGPRPPRGVALREWRAARAKLVEDEESLSALRQLREKEVGRPWTIEGTINIIETVIHLMSLFTLSKSAACAMVANKWHKSREKVLEVVNEWMEKRQVKWNPPQPSGAGSPRYSHQYDVGPTAVPHLRRALMFIR
jgi:hypothetical protein